MRRWISFALTVAMVFPAVAAAAEGTMANWLSPQPGQIVSGGKVEVSIGYNTSSKLKVTSLELYVDGQFYVRKILQNPETRGVCSFAWDTTRVEQGAHNLVVKVFSGDQVISKVYGTGTVGPAGSGSGLIDVRPPVVTFANIRAGDTLKGVKTIKMNAVDDSGKSPMVSLLVDENLKLLKNTPPYTYNLDTTTYTDGDHSLKTFAYDEAGNRSDPAVIKVAFRNGDSRPIVTTMTVDPAPKAEPKTTPVVSSKVIPSATTDAQQSIKSAARTQTPSVAGPSSAAPVVKPEPKPAVKVAQAPKAEPKPVVVAKVDPKPVPVSAAAAKVAAPAVSSGPVKMASAAGASSLRMTNLKPSAVGSTGAAKPAAVAAPIQSAVRTTASAKLPSARMAASPAPKLASSPQPAAPKIAAAVAPKPAAAVKPVEPKRVVAAPKTSAPVRMAMASAASSTHKTTVAAAPRPAVAAAPVVMAKAVASPLRAAPVTHTSAVKSADISGGMPSGAVAAAPKTVVAPGISKSALKRVQVAMAPNIRSLDEQVLPRPAISRPPAPVKQAKAKLEKAVVPASGKVKARSFFEGMGGVLFWDPSTHTVTACVANMTIEMRIGSKTAMVNGHEFEMAVAPYLIGGRTFFEARTFSQACNLLETLQTVGKAELQ